MGDERVGATGSPLGEEDAALAAIVRSSTMAVISKTVDGTITAWNEGATLMYGYTSTDMLGHNVEEMIPDEVLVEERERHARVAGGGSEIGYRCLRRRVDGRPILVVMSLSPVRDESGSVVGVASISRPLSAQEGSDARFASLIEAAPDAMVCIDQAGLITLVNERVQDMFGYARDELVGQPVELLLPAELAETHRRNLRSYFEAPRRGPMGLGLALEGARRDGTTFPVEVALAVDEVSDVPLVIAAVRDVTAQRAVEATARENETRLQQLAEHLDTAFLVHQIQPPAFLYVSPGYRALTGADPEDLLESGGGTLDFVHAEDRDRVDAAFEDAFRGEAVHLEFRIVHLDGTVRWVRAYANPVPNPHGPPERVVSAATDITGLVLAEAQAREAEARAVEANDAKNEFLSRMSHELRTPLNAILGFGQILERLLAAPQQAEYAHHVVSAGRHLLALIDDVLDIARIESGDLSVSSEPIEIESVVADVVSLMAPQADAAGITVNVVGGPPEVHAKADRQRLRQALLNLVSNGIKYNHRGGSVTLHWMASRGKASITVTDDGPGIDPDLHDRVFVAFDRLGAEASEVEGTGVGLTVTRALVELMDGELAFRSDVGKGTTFTLTFTAGDAPSLTPSSPVPDVSRVPSPARGSATLLYIEDNEPNVRVMEAVIHLRPRWRLIHAALGQLGLDLASAHAPDLVLLDVHLPDMAGIDVLRALKADPSTAEIPIVVLSADANPRQIDRLRSAGAQQYLTKPLDLEKTLGVLDEIADGLAEAADPST